jgi:hypothetical protein
MKQLASLVAITLLAHHGCKSNSQKAQEGPQKPLGASERGEGIPAQPREVKIDPRAVNLYQSGWGN